MKSLCCSRRFLIVQASLIFFALLPVVPFLSPQVVFAQEQGVQQARAQTLVLPLRSATANRLSSAVHAFASGGVRKLPGNESWMSNVPPPPPPDPPSVTPFQPNVKWGGRTIAVTVSPANTATAIAASESGGLFLTTDSGATWSHIDSFPPFRMSDVKFAPSNSQIVVASAWADSRTTNGGGIWRSVDGGVTWQKPATSNPPCSTRASTWGISFAPNAADVFVGTDCGVAVSHDLGATWTHVAANPSGINRVVWGVAAQSGGIVDVCGSDGHHRSTNSGGIWTAAVAAGACSYGVTVHAIADSPLESNVLFVAASATALMESDDGGVTWTNLTPPTGASRPPWVKTHLSSDGNASHFDVYFGSGLQVVRQTCTNTGGPGLRCSTTWTNVSVDHADQNDLAFSTSSNCAQFIVSDGGVHKTSDCGANWTMTGTGNSGYNALQLYEVGGQVHPSHTDLYMGTQDNDIWASGDNGVTWATDICCEGFFFQVSHSSPSDAGQTVTGVDCFGCGNFETTAHFSGFSNWPNPAGTVTGNPFLVGPGEYVQFNQPTPPSNTLNLTTNTGGSWAAATTVAQSLSGRPYVSGPSASPTIYQAITKPSSLVGLIKITGVGTGTVTVADADTGLNNIGGYCMGFQTFVCPTVFGVDPNNPLHVIAVDSGTNQMKITIDGGATWTPDPVLTTLVTGNGQFLFSDPNFGITAHVIAFDPSNGNRILVGTEANGIIASLDGGQTWGPMFQSSQVPAITSFFFDEVQNTILVSSYGRGLWKLSIVPRATALAYTGDTAADYHDPATLTAVLTDTSVTPAVPVFGVPVTFSLGTQSCSAQTDINGQASCVITLNQTSGSYTVMANFAGNGLYLASSTSNAFTINREETTLTYTGDTLVANGGTAHLSAVLKEDGLVPITGRTITFTLGAVTPQTCSGTTDLTGTAQCVISPVAQLLGPGTVSANFAGDLFYLPASASAQTLLFAFLSRGSFVVGDRSDTGSVTFWGARWSKVNSLSGGPASASFKGFANNLSSTPPACGGTWSTTPGNSSSPPADVPTFMAVVVSSKITKSGNRISGDIAEIVVVQTAPGYAPNPGHPGTGLVLAEFCHVAGAARAFTKVSVSQLSHLAPQIHPIGRPPKPLPSTSVAAAYLQLAGTIAIAGQTTASTGDKVTVYGSGFCGLAGCSPVTVTVGTRVAAEGVQVGADGTFKATITITEIPSRYVVTAFQSAADGSKLGDSAPLVVPIEDEIPTIPIG